MSRTIAIEIGLWARRALAVGLLALSALIVRPHGPTAAEPIRIAVFDLELDDRSAGGGVVALDAHDTQYLRQATELARQMLGSFRPLHRGRHRQRRGRDQRGRRRVAL